MRIKEICLKNFGPFRSYNLKFPEESKLSILLVGKNNEGKSTIIKALKFVHDAFKVLGKKKNEISIDGEIYYALNKNDMENIVVGRMIFNYSSEKGEIKCQLSDGFEVFVYLDSSKNLIYADYIGRIPDDISEIIGIFPPLGPISEHEAVISNMSYLKSNINTSLAPRHLRNYFSQLLTTNEFKEIADIVQTSWKGIVLNNIEFNYEQNELECFYLENGILREISWAGQGLQIWIQLITHLIISKRKKVLILDEPEVNLHPEMQNELLNIFKQYYAGTLIIATHSIELMNNVNIRHIIHINKKETSPLIKNASRNNLEKIRNSIGSNFNFIASQFEDVDYLIFTENKNDYTIIKMILDSYKINIKDKNISIEGFNNYRIVKPYKMAYNTLLGKNPNCILFLDKDYFPDNYLDDIKRKMQDDGINLSFTSGKEIENIFISSKMYFPLLSEEMQQEFENWFTENLNNYKESLIADYSADIHKYAKNKKDIRTIYKESTKKINIIWQTEEKYNIVPGKKVLRDIRNYFQNTYSITLTLNKLVELLLEENDQKKLSFILDYFRFQDNLCSRS